MNCDEDPHKNFNESKHKEFTFLDIKLSVAGESVLLRKCYQNKNGMATGRTC